MTFLLRLLGTALTLMVALLVLALVTLNEASVTVQLGVVDVPTLPLGLVVAAALGCGFVLGLLLAASAVLRGMGRQRRLRREVGELGREVQDLRTLPLRRDR